jgi:predicted nuclease of predicted toxin-antitoxin system
MLGLTEADDLQIWNYAKSHNLVIVTQDSDYADWNKLRGAPPKIIWLRCGNTTVDQMHLKMRSSAGRIQTLESELDIEVIEIW